MSQAVTPGYFIIEIAWFSQFRLLSVTLSLASVSHPERRFLPGPAAQGCAGPGKCSLEWPMDLHRFALQITRFPIRVGVAAWMI